MKKIVINVLILVFLMTFICAPTNVMAEDASGVLITMQPQDAHISYDETAIFKVAAENAERFEWQYYDSGNSGRKPGWYNTNEWTLGENGQSSITRKGKYSNRSSAYRCKITGIDGSVVYSEVAKLKVGGPELLKGPSDVVCNVGDTVTLSVCVSHKASRIEWYYWSVEKNSWCLSKAKGNNIKNSTESKLIVTPNGSSSVLKYKCHIYYKEWIHTETEPVMIMLSDAPRITKQPRDARVNLNDDAVFSVSSSNAKKYQWQYYSNSKMKWVNSGAKGNKTSSLLLNGKGSYHNLKYRCRITSQSGVVVYSDSAQLLIKTAPQIITQPCSLEVQPYETGTFTVLANGKNLRYQWQYKKSYFDSATSTYREKWVNSRAKGAQTNTLTPPVETDNDANYWVVYRCLITDDDGISVETDSVYIYYHANL